MEQNNSYYPEIWEAISNDCDQGIERDCRVTFPPLGAMEVWRTAHADEQHAERARTSEGCLHPHWLNLAANIERGLR